MRTDDLGQLLTDAKPEVICSDPTEIAIAPPAVAPASTAPPPASPTAGLAAKITAARTATTRQRGEPVAGMVPNDEQEEILAACISNQFCPDEFGGRRVVVVCAGAGTGKTSTDRMLEQVLKGRGQYTAFNKSLVEESRPKFLKASVATTHSLAFRAVGRDYQHRLGGERVKSWAVAQALGIKDFVVTLRGAGEPLVPGSDAYIAAEAAAGYGPDNPAPADFAPTADRTKTLHAPFLAGQVLAAIRRFCQSADREISCNHLRTIAGIDLPYVDDEGTERMGRENNDRVREYLGPYLTRAWDDLIRTDGTLPFTHDCYVKIWQLGEGEQRPVIAADYILLDEAQDTAPVFLDVIAQQAHALLVLVGDDNQQIYEWRGAVNAMTSFPGAPRLLLSQSYRFGQAIADAANAVLDTLEQPTDLVLKGRPGLPSRVAEVAEPKCYLYRTNAGAVARIMRAVEEGKRGHLIGGGDETVKWCQAAMDLQSKRGTQHPELACFADWKEVQEYSKTDEGQDLKLMVKLVDTFGAEAIRDALRDMPKEAEADLICSTAHKSKGREWDTVRLGPDFPTANRMTDSDRRLLYVALTRARHTLDVSECPPFCGAEDGLGEQRRWIPGIEITFTQPMPTEEDQVAWIAAKNAPKTLAAPLPASVAQSPTQPAPNAAAGIVAPANGSGAGGEFSWANLGNGWCVRGPKVEVGARVKVVRRDGTSSVVTVRAVVKQIGELWFYSV